MKSAHTNKFPLLFISQIILLAFLTSTSYCETISNEFALELVKAETKANKIKRNNHSKMHTQNKNTQPYPKDYWNPPGRYDGGSEPDPI